MKAIKSMSVGGKAVKLCKMGGGVMFSKSRKYEAVEWLESHGDGNNGEFVDTLIAPGDSTGIWCDFAPLSWSDCIMMGCAGAAQNTRFVLNMWLDSVYLSWNTRHKAKAITKGQRVVAGMNFLGDKSRYVDGEQCAPITEPLGTISQNIGLFGCYWGTQRPQFKMAARLFGAKISRGNRIIADLHPARRIEDGELGLYDSVRDIFFTNEGAGAFTAGPETGEYY